MWPTPSSTPDLFADSPPDAAIAELQNWFEAWLGHLRSTGQLRKTSSEERYRVMWTVLLTWCVTQNPPVRLLTISSDDLRVFLASRTGQVAGELAARYAWRLLNLVDRVLRFAASQLNEPANRAASDLMDRLPTVRYANATDNEHLGYLPADEARRLVVLLSEIRPRGQKSASPRDWRELRNAASVGLQLGAGLTPGDVRILRLKDVISVGGRLLGVPWKLALAGDGNTPARETPVAQWAGQLLKYWLAVRAERGLPGEWVFPATGTGKPWSPAAQYQAASDLLEAAGIDADRGGSFRLRHTFALRQLRRGKSRIDVARWMGIQNLKELDRYDRILHSAVDVV